MVIALSVRLKRILRYCFKKMGYEIAKLYKDTGIDSKLAGWIIALEDIYRELIFKEYPLTDPKRISLMARLMGTTGGEIIYVLNYLRHCMQIDGDVCEFGVAQGRTSAVLAYEVINTDKKIWLFDSFQGLPKPSKKDVLLNDIFNLGSIERYEGSMAWGIDMVKEELKNICFPEARTIIVPGFIEKTLKSCNLPSKVCFAYVDLDFYEPTLEVLNFLDKVLQDKGVIIIDDYGFFSKGAKTAADEFISANRERYKFSLPIKSAGYFCIIEKI